MDVKLRPSGTVLLVFAAATLMAASGACERYTHSNPFDPLTPVTDTIIGPDTIMSLGGLATYSLVTHPALVDPSAQWGASFPIAFSIFSQGAAGVFSIQDAPLYPRFDTVTVTVAVGRYETTYVREGSTLPVVASATFYRRTFSRTVLLTQRLVRLRLRCPQTSSCDPLASGDSSTVWLDGFDALGSEIYGLPSITNANPPFGEVIGAFASRDSTIASVSPRGVRAGVVRAGRSGSTWIVASRDELRDSVLVTVK